jgi:hypothetical protein
MSHEIPAGPQPRRGLRPDSEPGGFPEELLLVEPGSDTGSVVVATGTYAPLIAGKCATTLRRWLGRGESLRADRYR